VLGTDAGPLAVVLAVVALVVTPHIYLPADPRDADEPCADDEEPDSDRSTP
jgi:hypothetical protein